MIAVLQSLRAWLDGRSPRERILLAVMAVGVLGVLLWLGVARPIADWREDARDRRAEAALDLALLRAAGGGDPASVEALEATARAAADAAGLNVVFSPAADGLAFTVSGAPSPALFGWLGGLGGEGVEARALAVSENADATLDAQGLLSGGQSAR